MLAFTKNVGLKGLICKPSTEASLMAALLLRRAFPSSLVPVGSRSPPPSSYLFASRLLPFSTYPAGEIPDKSPEDSYHSIVEKFEKEVDSCSSGQIPLPSGYPFAFAMHDYVAYAWKGHGTKEVVLIDSNGYDPSMSMDVVTRTRGVEVSAKITPKPDQLHIHQVKAWDP